MQHVSHDAPGHRHGARQATRGRTTPGVSLLWIEDGSLRFGETTKAGGTMSGSAARGQTPATDCVRETSISARPTGWPRDLRTHNPDRNDEDKWPAMVRDCPSVLRKADVRKENAVAHVAESKI